MRPYAFWVFGSPALAIFALVLIASLIGLTKAETERIWLPFVPLACVAAAAAVKPPRLKPLLAALGAQALLFEVLFFTVW
jgi:hypothetical protein